MSNENPFECDSHPENAPPWTATLHLRLERYGVQREVKAIYDVENGCANCLAMSLGAELIKAVEALLAEPAGNMAFEGAAVQLGIADPTGDDD